MSSGIVNRIFKRKSVWTVIYAVYLSLILLSVNAFIAQESIDNMRADLDDQYTYHLTFEEDGVKTHYDVTRHNSNQPGKVTLTYYTLSNKIDITNIENIKTIDIDMQSIFEDEADEVFNKPSSEISEQDLIDQLAGTDGILTIEFDIDESEPVESVTFTNFPTPTSVMINNADWSQTDLDYTLTSNEITFTNLPTGFTIITIDFIKENQMPVASFIMTPSGYAGVNENIIFDGRASNDPDGVIEIWLWDFGDGGQETGKVVTHKYTEPGNYTIKLTVRNNDVPFSEAWIERTIEIAFGAEDDFDNDTLRDLWEWNNFGNLDQDVDDDPDSDGYPNLLEQYAGTDPSDESSYEEDFDGDTLPDLWEWEYFDSLKYGPEDDPDSDEFTLKQEFEADTDPSDPTSVPSEKKEAADSGWMIYLIPVIAIIIIVVIILLFMSRRGAGELEEEMEVPREPSGEPFRRKPREPSRGIKRELPQRLPKKLPAKAPERVPEKIPEKAPRRLPEKIPEQVPKRLPKRLPEGLMDRIPKKLPLEQPKMEPKKIEEEEEEDEYEYEFECPECGKIISEDDEECPRCGAEFEAD
ncbi:MAG: PKD domain-containing protein [Thermoplasmata archaeon]|nr:MAG: PKD domain-containing protein [Thermoplasmata archaeon]